MRNTQVTGNSTTVQEDSRVMVDLILVDEDTGVFGYEVSVQDDVFCGTWGHRFNYLSNTLRNISMANAVLSYQWGIVKGT